MAYFPDNMPRPTPNMDDAGFWEGCRRQRLLFQCCGECNAPRHPPTPVCPRCHSTNMSWTEARGDGEVYSYNVIHHASHPAVRERLPYVGAVITFSDVPGVRLISNVTDCDPSSVHIGMKVALWWDDIGEGMFAPRFRPEGREAAS